jgi:hypothetical protein
VILFFQSKHASVVSTLELTPSYRKLQCSKAMVVSADATGIVL